ncbi:unnamed protein product, partial [Phaeothamnion confervicola]
PGNILISKDSSKRFEVFTTAIVLPETQRGPVKRGTQSRAPSKTAGISCCWSFVFDADLGPPSDGLGVLDKGGGTEGGDWLHVRKSAARLATPKGGSGRKGLLWHVLLSDGNRRSARHCLPLPSPRRRESRPTNFSFLHWFLSSQCRWIEYLVLVLTKLIILLFAACWNVAQLYLSPVLPASAFLSVATGHSVAVERQWGSLR